MLSIILSCKYYSFVQKRKSPQMQNFARLRSKTINYIVILATGASLDGHPRSIHVSAIAMKFIDADPFFRISRANLTEGENERQTWT